VGDCFVERPLVPIRGEIKLERFAFDAEPIGHVIDVDPGEVWLASHRTKTGEIVCLEMDMIISARRVGKSFQARLRRCFRKFRFTPTEQCQGTRLRFCALHRLNVPRASANLQLSNRWRKQTNEAATASA